MSKKIISFILALIMCLSAFPVEAYAKENKAYQAYQDAIQVTTSSGSWTEDLTMTANMSISKGSAKTKTKVTITSNMDVSNYSANDLSSIKMSGSADMSVMGQKYAWNIKYENGIAHYEYTEPDQTTADIEMDPSCFDFNSMTADMMEKAKVSGNKITFTIPGNKMEEAGIAAVNMMSDIENLDYDDVDVEVLIDKETGAVEKMIMAFHASLTYQGYDAEVDYQIDYNFTCLGSDNGVSESNENDAVVELKAYAAFPESTIGTEQEVKIQFSLYADGELKPIEEYALGIRNPSVIESVKDEDSNGSRIITFKGVNPGTSDVTFTEATTGTTITISITVEDKCNYFRCSAFPIPYESSGSIYVADYACVVDENGNHDISFNAYNTSYAYGVVEVYDADGSLIRIVPLDPKSDGSGMEKVVNGFKWVWDDIKDIFDGETQFFTKESNAKHTPVSLENIPENSEIIITSDGSISNFSALYTGTDVFVRTVFAASSIDLKKDGQVKTVKELMNALADSLIKSVSHEETEKMIAQGMIKEATETISTSLSFASSTDSVSEIYETMYNLFQSLEIDAESIMLNILKGMGYSVADTAFTTAVPLYKIVNFVDQVLETAWPLTDYQFNCGRGKMEVHVSKHGLQNFIVNSAVTVKQSKTFSDNTVLDAYVVTNDEELQSISNFATWDMTNYSVYSITLRENGKEIQPDEIIEVQVPIPMNVNEEKCVVYRIEDDGKRTKLDLAIDEGYVVFKTEHLSYYIVGEEGISLVAMQYMAVVGAGSGIIIAISILLFKLKKRKKQNND